jgi:hypothetical protein
MVTAVKQSKDKLSVKLNKSVYTFAGHIRSLYEKFDKFLKNKRGRCSVCKIMWWCGGVARMRTPCPVSEGKQRRA